MLVTPPLTHTVTEPLAQRSGRPRGRGERRAVTLHGFAVRADGSTAAVKLTDLSYDGCGIETAVELKPGEPIQLLILRGPVSSEVRWCAHGRAGLTFAAAPAAQKQRVSSRSEPITLTAEVSRHRSGKPCQRARVLDLSPHGCRLELTERIDADDVVWIKFDALEALEAKACWVAGFTAGVKYLNPFHPAVFDLLLATSRPSGGQQQAISA